jgi:molybdate transport system ATP-binding protein
MILRCRIPLASFEIEVDVSFDAKVTAIFGPSGAGKTTLLDAVAGLKKIAAGEIEIDGRLLFSSSRGIHLSPQQRSIGYVPQEAALFPHRSVRQNILFGSERKQSPNQSAGLELNHVAELLEIAHLLDRSVAHLSGGEAQRVALARALVSRPQLLLLDEPLASLDIGLKERILPYLRRVRDEFAIPMIYVTHNPAEVLSLANWVIMIRQGKVIGQGLPQEVLVSRPALSAFEEEQIENIFDARLIAADAAIGTARIRLRSGLELVVPANDKKPGSLLQVRIRGDDILVATKRPEGISAGNIFPGTVQKIDVINGQCILSVDAGEVFSVRLTASAVARLALAAGQGVFLIIKARSCAIL